MYFLFLRRHLTYIGRSVHVVRRLSQHTDSGNTYDEAHILEAHEDHCDGLESYYLHVLTPPRNVTKKHHASRCHEILAEEYGLYHLPDGYAVGEPPPPPPEDN